MTAVAYSPQDATCLASASIDGSLRLWNGDSGEEVLRYNQGSSGIMSISFCPGSESHIVTGADNGCITTWDARLSIC